MSRNRISNISVILNKEKKTYYAPIKYPKIPLSINDVYVITTVGDRLDKIAEQFYKDIRLWWIIAIANKDIVRRDSYTLKPGLEIRIPYNIETILKEYKKINKNSIGYGYN
tara:strand:+ start:31 stop:363 length:333 start_codon:yes stop_codon:yes gene_type:complete